MKSRSLIPAIIRRGGPLASLFEGAAWRLAGSLISRGSSLAYFVVAARVLGPKDFGAFGVVTATVGMAQVLAGAGLGVTATRHVARYRLSDPERAARVLSLCELTAAAFAGATATALLLLSPALARGLANPALEAPLRASGLMLFLGAVTGAQSGALIGCGAFGTLTRTAARASLIGLPAMAAAAWWGTVEAFVWGLAAPMAALLVLNQRALAREVRRKSLLEDGWWSERGLLLGFSLPAFAGSLIAAAANWACAAMLARSAGGYSEMGIYSAAFQWYNVLIFVPDLIGQVALPMLAGERDVENRRGIVKAAVGINASVVGPLVLVALIASPLIMRLYGPAYAGSAPTLAVTVLVAGVVALQMPLVDRLVASGRMWAVTALNAAWAAALLLFSQALVSHGAFGMVCARLLAYAVYAAVLAWLTLRGVSEAEAQDAGRRPSGAPVPAGDTPWG